MYQSIVVSVEQQREEKKIRIFNNVLAFVVYIETGMGSVRDGRERRIRLSWDKMWKRSNHEETAFIKFHNKMFWFNKKEEKKNVIVRMMG